MNNRHFRRRCEVHSPSEYVSRSEAKSPLLTAADVGANTVATEKGKLNQFMCDPEENLKKKGKRNFLKFYMKRAKQPMNIDPVDTSELAKRLIGFEGAVIPEGFVLPSSLPVAKERCEKGGWHCLINLMATFL